MRSDTGNLCFQQSNARVQFVQRIAIQAFAGQLASGSVFYRSGAPSWSIIVVHLRCNIGLSALAVNRVPVYSTDCFYRDGGAHAGTST